MKVKIRLETRKDAQELSNIAYTVGGKTIITDGNGLAVNAQSIIGVLYSMEFDNLWLESDTEFYSKIEKFVVVGQA